MATAYRDAQPSIADFIRGWEQGVPPGSPRFEGYHPDTGLYYPYKDAGTTSIGYGSNPHKGDENGITFDQVLQRSQEVIDRAQSYVSSMLATQAPNAQLTDNQYGALVSTAMNAGLPGSIWAAINSGNMDQAATILEGYGRHAANGDPSFDQGLASRRTAEAAVFRGADPSKVGNGGQFIAHLAANSASAPSQVASAIRGFQAPAGGSAPHPAPTTLDDLLGSKSNFGQGITPQHYDPRVAEMQQFINDRYGPAGIHIAVDGVVGPQTDAAIRAFQSQQGLHVDGIVGPETMGKVTALASSDPLGFGDTPHNPNTGPIPEPNPRHEIPVPESNPHRPVAEAPSFIPPPMPELTGQPYFGPPAAASPAAAPSPTVAANGAVPAAPAAPGGGFLDEAGRWLGMAGAGANAALSNFFGGPSYGAQAAQEAPLSVRGEPIDETKPLPTSQALQPQVSDYRPALNGVPSPEGLSFRDPGGQSPIVSTFAPSGGSPPPPQIPSMAGEPTLSALTPAQSAYAPPVQGVDSFLPAGNPMASQAQGGGIPAGAPGAPNDAYSPSYGDLKKNGGDFPGIDTLIGQGANAGMDAAYAGLTGAAAIPAAALSLLSTPAYGGEAPQQYGNGTADYNNRPVGVTSTGWGTLDDADAYAQSHPSVDDTRGTWNPITGRSGGDPTSTDNMVAYAPPTATSFGHLDNADLDSAQKAMWDVLGNPFTASDPNRQAQVPAALEQSLRSTGVPADVIPTISDKLTEAGYPVERLAKDSAISYANPAYQSDRAAVQQIPMEPPLGGAPGMFNPGPDAGTKYRSFTEEPPLPPAAAAANGAGTGAFASFLGGMPMSPLEPMAAPPDAKYGRVGGDWAGLDAAMGASGPRPTTGAPTSYAPPTQAAAPSAPVQPMAMPSGRPDGGTGGIFPIGGMSGSFDPGRYSQDQEGLMSARSAMGGGFSAGAPVRPAGDALPAPAFGGPAGGMPGGGQPQGGAQPSRTGGVAGAIAGNMLPGGAVGGVSSWGGTDDPSKFNKDAWLPPGTTWESPADTGGPGVPDNMLPDYQPGTAAWDDLWNNSYNSDGSINVP